MHALRENELPTRATDCESAYVRSPIQPPIHAPTRTRAWWQKGRERERPGPVYRGEREREIESARARALEKERESDLMKGETEKGERVGTKETGKANDPGRTRGSRRIPHFAPAIPLTLVTLTAEYRATFIKKKKKAISTDDS